MMNISEYFGVFDVSHSVYKYLCVFVLTNPSILIYSLLLIRRNLYLRSPFSSVFMGKQLSPQRRGEILGMMESGVSARAAAAKFNVDKSVAGLIWAKSRSGGGLGRAVGSGRPKKTTPREDKMVVRMVKKDRDTTAEQIKEQLNLQHISDSTVYRRIEAAALTKSSSKISRPRGRHCQSKP